MYCILAIRYRFSLQIQKEAFSMVRTKPYLYHVEGDIKAKFYELTKTTMAL